MSPEEKKLRIKYAKMKMDEMSDRQKIKVLNTPYGKLPTYLQFIMTKNPQTFNFVRMAEMNMGRQQERFGARLIRYRKKYNLTRENFVKVCNEYAERFDLSRNKGYPPQKTRITLRDIENYEYRNVSPKIDKMTIIAGATDYEISYFAGYGPNNPAVSMFEGIRA